jgi:hypothetical protein
MHPPVGRSGNSYPNLANVRYAPRQVVSHRVRAIARLIFAIAAAVSATGAVAQGAVARELGSTKDFREFNAAICGSMVSRLVNRPELEAVQRARGVDIATTCSCASETVLRDEWLQKQLTGTEEQLHQRMGSGVLLSYFSARVASAAFNCLATEIEKSLEVVRQQ